MRPLVVRLLSWIDLSTHISNHISGESHTPTHKKVVGFVIMIIGVTLAKATMFLSHTFIFEMLADVVGFGLHAIGLIPFAKRYER